MFGNAFNRFSLAAAIVIALHATLLERSALILA